MKKIIHIIFVLVCLYLCGYCLSDSLPNSMKVPNDGVFQNSRNPSPGFSNLRTLKSQFLGLYF